MLGASEELKAELIKYIIGYAIGIIPMLLAQQIAAFLQLERQSTLGYIGIAGMIVSNTFFNVLFVVVFGMGMWGLALATSGSNILYFLILVPYYFTSKAQFHYRLKDAYWKDLGNLLKIGIPGALLVFCISIRGIVINRILIRYAGNDALQPCLPTTWYADFLLHIVLATVRSSGCWSAFLRGKRTSILCAGYLELFSQKE